MIQVNEDYIIDIDSLNYTVRRDLHKTGLRKDPVTKEEVSCPLYSTVGYYSDLTSAIKGAISDMNRRQLKDGVVSLKEAVSIVLSNNRKVSELLERALEV